MKFLIIFFSLLTFNLYAQKNLKILDLKILETETILSSSIPEVEVLSFKNNEERIKYLILKRKVKKVYPYALLAKRKILEIQCSLDTISKKRHKKKFIKSLTKSIKEDYSDELKQLTMSEGKILVKLIYRETNNTSYQIVRDFRGRFNAFFWQTMAIFWKNNLKTKYDPKTIQEDALIEHILKSENLILN